MKESGRVSYSSPPVNNSSFDISPHFPFQAQYDVSGMQRHARFVSAPQHSIYLHRNSCDDKTPTQSERSDDNILLSEDFQPNYIMTQRYHTN